MSFIHPEPPRIPPEEDGSLHAPGTVIVRIRAFGRDEPPRWELSYRATNGADDWTVIAEGNPTVSTFNVGTGGQFLEPVEIQEHGVYELRLVVSDRERTEEIVETVQITVVE